MIKLADLTENRKATRATLPKYIYPDCVLTSANVGYMCKHHTPFALRREECTLIRRLDAQGTGGGIFGSGYLLGTRCALRRAAAERAAAERAAAERAAAERAAAERAAATVWELSPRERALQALIDKRLEGAGA